MISSNLSRDRYILSNYVYEQDSKLFVKFVKISVAKTLSTFLDQTDAIDGQEESLASNTMSISNVNFPDGKCCSMLFRRSLQDN